MNPRPFSFATASLLALAAMLPAAAPAAAQVPAYVTVDVSITNYTMGSGQVHMRLSCDGMPEPYWFDLNPGETSGSFGPFSVPASSCTVEVDGLGDPGDLGEWGEISYSPGQTQPTVEDQTTHFDVSVERTYNGGGLDWDVYGWVGMSPLTVDKVTLNKTGGITAEGAILCPDFASWPGGGDAFVNVNWDAKEYVGRRTTIHGSYRSDIATRCWVDADAGEVQRWATLSGANNGATKWIYGSDGKFAAGTVIVDVWVEGEVSSVTQGWDPQGPDYDSACTMDWREDGYFDQNGDGFCAYYLGFGGGDTFPVRTTALKTR